MKTKLLLLALFFYSQVYVFGQCPAAGYTCISDSNFEQALIDQGIDSEGNPADGRVLTVDISGIIDLDVSSNFISDMTGIEAFSSLQTLDCSFNQLIALDLFNNTALLEIDCGENNIGNGGNQLILPNNNILTSLICRGNNLSSLNVSAYPDLEVLQCYNNGPSDIGTLNLNANTKLIDLICHNAGITSIDISTCSNLDTLWCFTSSGTPPNSNSLSTLDISSNLALSEVRCFSSGINTFTISNSPYNNMIYLDCSDNPIGSLDVSVFPNLETLYCANNNLNTIDVFGLTSLVDFGLWSNNLSSLDLSNNANLEYVEPGSNTNLSNLTLSKQ